MSDKQIHEYLPPIRPIDLQSAIPIQRLISGNWTDDAITPQDIIDAVPSSGGGLVPQAITADQVAESGKLYIGNGSIFLSLPSTLIPGVTRFAITNPEPGQNFAIHPNTGQQVRLDGAIADDTKTINNITHLAYCELIAVDETAMIVIAGVQVGIFDYSAGGGGN